MNARIGLSVAEALPSTVVAGATLGLGLAYLPENPLPIGLLFVGATAGEWLLVRLKPFGEFTLRPVAVFVALWTTGLGGYLIVGIAPVILVRALTGRTTIRESLSAAGRDTAALWSGMLAFWAADGIQRGFYHEYDFLSVALRASNMAAYWGVQVILQALALSVVEGIRYRSALAYFFSRAGIHIVVLSLAAVSLDAVTAEFGFLVMGIATFVLAEAYYPWKLLGEQGDALLTSLQVLAQAVDLKDPYTSGHSQRVAQYAVRLARVLRIPEEEVERIRIGALMHDIGKIGVSGKIIRKPGRLTNEEHVLMATHSTIGADIIASLEMIGESAEMVRHHHEHWDGSGYPRGLRGRDIPVGARIILVADAFDALTTDRPYRTRVSPGEAIEIIRAHAGTQFDPEVVDALEKLGIRL